MLDGPLLAPAPKLSHCLCACVRLSCCREAKAGYRYVICEGLEWQRLWSNVRSHEICWASVESERCGVVRGRVMRPLSCVLHWQAGVPTRRSCCAELDARVSCLRAKKVGELRVVSSEIHLWIVTCHGHLHTGECANRKGTCSCGYDCIKAVAWLPICISAARQCAGKYKNYNTGKYKNWNSWMLLTKQRLDRIHKMRNSTYGLVRSYSNSVIIRILNKLLN